MAYAQFTGNVVSTEPLVVDLDWFNGRNPGVYDFAGTGVTPADDADPSNYDVETGLLPLSTIADGDLLRVRGLVTEFATAPADFNARTLIDIQTDMRGATLWVGWTEGTPTPFLTSAPDRVDVDLSAARKVLKLRGVPRDFIELMEDIALVANDDGQGIYAVKVRGAGEIQLFRSFSALADELISQLDAGRHLHRITAQGQYKGTANELTTGRAGFVFNSIEDVD